MHCVANGWARFVRVSPVVFVLIGRSGAMHWKCLERRVLVMGTKANLFEVIAATHAAGRLYYRQQQAHQNAKDGDCNTPFNKRETVASSSTLGVKHSALLRFVKKNLKKRLLLRFIGCCIGLRGFLIRLNPLFISLDVILISGHRLRRARRFATNERERASDKKVKRTWASSVS